jgi:hypothetical protein
MAREMGCLMRIFDLLRRFLCAIPVYVIVLFFSSRLNPAVSSLRYFVFALISYDWYTFVFQWGLKGDHSMILAGLAVCFRSSCFTDPTYFVSLLPTQITIFTADVVLLAISYLRCILTSSAVEDNPPPADYFARLSQLAPNEPPRFALDFASCLLNSLSLMWS